MKATNRLLEGTTDPTNFKSVPAVPAEMRLSLLTNYNGDRINIGGFVDTLSDFAFENPSAADMVHEILTADLPAAPRLPSGRYLAPEVAQALATKVLNAITEAAETTKQAVATV